MADTKHFFHSRDGICFRRLDDGSVQVFRKCTTNDDETEIVELDASSWASVVAYVSAKGETGETYRTALAFHEDHSA